ncbi:3-oxoacyl-ACP synthase III family protein [Shewanella woodyi]|uniref:Beta-ketoacyl-acyl-carrier-protein synthase I n=1 Tax=Shewanella woodyi (strain ATCC 51908 / MS32) TaxID=392500 RepID=B1KMF7_SHEWM|nr:beta-ketoacyl-ACP synthase 3 [Shewanella woodyi]ACA85955.1 Beta-ketoacyl-acyl-carrier-protein synthase I [Shewanella woodyi ATCC 51908]
MKSKIIAVSSYLPEYILTNEELARDNPEWSVNKIYDKTGISTRHIAAEAESCSDMAVAACENLLKEYSVNRADIDYVLLCTQSPDFKLPTTACIVQERLGLKNSCGALDFNLGCSGYIYGLSLAKGLIETNQAKNILLVTSELYSRYIAKEDKSVRTLFGDAATATLISCSNSNEDKIGPFVFGTDGAGKDNLIVPHGGAKYPFDASSDVLEQDSSGNYRAPKNLFMDGGEIFTFTLKTVPKSVDALLELAGFEREQIDHVIFHQANKFMLEQLRKKCKFNDEKFLTSYEFFGNTVSSTIPLGINEAIKADKFNPGDKIMLVGFGVGYSWAGTIITW